MASQHSAQCTELPRLNQLSSSPQSQFWNSLPSADISMQIDFHGLTLDTGSQLFIVGGTSLPRLQVTSKIRLEAFSPSISFGE